jgi:hypothetical protein
MKRVVRRRFIRNPYRKPASQITDRAKRYRASSKRNRPGPPKQCNYCGSRRNVGVHHVNGVEDDGAGHNLQWACKRCNATIAGVMRRAGIGRRVEQFNAARRVSGSKRAIMEKYAAAIKVMRGEFEGDPGAAVATIRATPASIRSEYTSRTWPTRRQMYGPSGRQTDLPF